MKTSKRKLLVLVSLLAVTPVMAQQVEPSAIPAQPYAEPVASAAPRAPADKMYEVLGVSGEPPMVTIRVNRDMVAGHTTRLAAHFQTTLELIRTSNLPTSTLILCRDERGGYPRALNPKRSVEERKDETVWNNCDSTRRGLYIPKGLIYIPAPASMLRRGKPMRVPDGVRLADPTHSPESQYNEATAEAIEESEERVIAQIDQRFNLHEQHVSDQLKGLTAAPLIDAAIVKNSVVTTLAELTRLNKELTFFRVILGIFAIAFCLVGAVLTVFFFDGKKVRLQLKEAREQYQALEESSENNKGQLFSALQNAEGDLRIVKRRRDELHADNAVLRAKLEEAKGLEARVKELEGLARGKGAEALDPSAFPGGRHAGHEET